MAVIRVSASTSRRVAIIIEVQANKPNVRIGNTYHLSECVAHTGAEEDIELLERGAVLKQTCNCNIRYQLASEKFGASEPRAAICQLRVAEMRVFDGLFEAAQVDCR